MSKVIEIKKIVEFETEELDFAFIDQTNEDGEPYEVIYAGEDTNFLDAYPIKIDEMISYLTRIKEAGGNYVSVEYHVDHYTYLIEGYKVETKS